MLSFLRGQEADKSFSQAASTASGNADDGDGQRREQEEYITVASQSETVRRSTILLFVLFGIGLLFLIFMIKKSTPATASASSVSDEEIKIERAITELTGVKSGIFSRMDEVVQKFYEFSNVEQVEVEELAKNPFRQKMFLTGLDVISNSTDKINHVEILRRQLRQQAESLELLSIMQSSGVNCCVIDDKIFYEGETVKDFRVIEIGVNFVRLSLDAEGERGLVGAESKDFEIVLKLLE